MSFHDMPAGLPSGNTIEHPNHEFRDLGQYSGGRGSFSKHGEARGSNAESEYSEGESPLVGAPAASTKKRKGKGRAKPSTSAAGAGGSDASRASVDSRSGAGAAVDADGAGAAVGYMSASSGDAGGASADTPPQTDDELASAASKTASRRGAKKKKKKSAGAVSAVGADTDTDADTNTRNGAPTTADPVNSVALAYALPQQLTHAQAVDVQDQITADLASTLEGVPKDAYAVVHDKASNNFNVVVDRGHAAELQGIHDAIDQKIAKGGMAVAIKTEASHAVESTSKAAVGPVNSITLDFPLVKNPTKAQVRSVKQQLTAQLASTLAGTDAKDAYTVVHNQASNNFSAVVDKAHVGDLHSIHEAIDEQVAEGAINVTVQQEESHAVAGTAKAAVGPINTVALDYALEDPTQEQIESVQEQILDELADIEALEHVSEDAYKVVHDVASNNFNVVFEDADVKHVSTIQEAIDDKVAAGGMGVSVTDSQGNEGLLQMESSSVAASANAAADAPVNSITLDFPLVKDPTKAQVRSVKQQLTAQLASTLAGTDAKDAYTVVHDQASNTFSIVVDKVHVGDLHSIHEAIDEQMAEGAMEVTVVSEELHAVEGTGRAAVGPVNTVALDYALPAAMPQEQVESVQEQITEELAAALEHVSEDAYKVVHDVASNNFNVVFEDTDVKDISTIQEAIDDKVAAGGMGVSVTDSEGNTELLQMEGSAANANSGTAAEGPDNSIALEFPLVKDPTKAQVRSVKQQLTAQLASTLAGTDAKDAYTVVHDQASNNFKVVFDDADAADIDSIHEAIDEKIAKGAMEVTVISEELHAVESTSKVSAGRVNTLALAYPLENPTQEQVESVQEQITEELAAALEHMSEDAYKVVHDVASNNFNVDFEDADVKDLHTIHDTLDGAAAEGALGVTVIDAQGTEKGLAVGSIGKTTGESRRTDDNQAEEGSERARQAAVNAVSPSSETMSPETEDTMVLTFGELDYSATDLELLNECLRKVMAEQTGLSDAVIAETAIEYTPGSVIATAAFPHADAAGQAKREREPIIAATMLLYRSGVSAKVSAADERKSAPPMLVEAKTGGGSGVDDGAQLDDADDADDADTDQKGATSEGGTPTSSSPYNKARCKIELLKESKPKAQQAAADDLSASPSTQTAAGNGSDADDVHDEGADSSDSAPQPLGGGGGGLSRSNGNAGGIDMSAIGSDSDSDGEYSDNEYVPVMLGQLGRQDNLAKGESPATGDKVVIHVPAKLNLPKIRKFNPPEVAMEPDLPMLVEETEADCISPALPTTPLISVISVAETTADDDDSESGSGSDSDSDYSSTDSESESEATTDHSLLTVDDAQSYRRQRDPHDDDDNIEEELDAVVVIQSGYRGYVARRDLKLEKLAREQYAHAEMKNLDKWSHDLMATRIQKTWRGFYLRASRTSPHFHSKVEPRGSARALRRQHTAATLIQESWAIWRIKRLIETGPLAPKMNIHGKNVGEGQGRPTWPCGHRRIAYDGAIIPDPCLYEKRKMYREGLKDSEHQDFGYSKQLPEIKKGKNIEKLPGRRKEKMHMLSKKPNVPTRYLNSYVETHAYKSNYERAAMHNNLEETMELHPAFHPDHVSDATRAAQQIEAQARAPKTPPPKQLKQRRKTTIPQGKNF